MIFCKKNLYLNVGCKLEQNLKNNSNGVHVPHLKFQNLHLLPNFDVVLWETSLVNTIITVAPQLAVLLLLLSIGLVTLCYSKSSERAIFQVCKFVEVRNLI